MKSLFLGCNRLTLLPDRIGLLEKLTLLDLSHNRLRELNDFVGQLSALEELNLSDNQLTLLPDSLGLLDSLKKLDASYNKIEGLSLKLAQLRSSCRIFVQENRLYREDADAFLAEREKIQKEYSDLGPQVLFVAHQLKRLVKRGEVNDKAIFDITAH